jgi:hypothetical protein
MPKNERNYVQVANMIWHSLKTKHNNPLKGGHILVPSSQLSTSQTNKFVYPYAFEELLGKQRKSEKFHQPFENFAKKREFGYFLIFSLKMK